jgi:DNA-binding CsgD family transcriptional regulator/tetratricopeptide (TPR) repeat protein
MELLERETHLDQLGSALRDAAAGRGRVVVVAGQAGMGKTVLLDAFLRTRCSGARVLSAACDDLATPRPLGPLLDLSPDLSDELRDALAGDLDPGRLFTHVVAELAGPPRPVVLALDDVQWVDQATLDLLIYLARRIDRLPALIVLGSRDDSDAAARVLAAARPGSASRLELAALSMTAVATIVGDRAADVYARTGGLPFFVQAIHEHDPGGLPSTVRDVVRSRAGALPAQTQQLLELIAIDPTGVRTSELDVTSPGWEAHAAPAERAGLLVHDRGLLGFVHELSRDALRSSLPAVRSRELHRQLLPALADTDLPRVVHHASGAEDLDRLAPASLRAAREARALHAHTQALAHYDRLAPHLDRLSDDEPRGPVIEEHAEELLAAGHIGDALDRLAEAIRLQDRPNERGRLLARRSTYLGSMGRHLEERAALDEAMAALEGLDPGVELAHACIYAAFHHLDGWELEPAARAAERALDLARDHRARDLEAYALMAQGAVTAAAGDADSAVATLAGSVTIADRIGHAGLSDAARLEIVDALLEHRRLEEADAAIDAALATGELHEHQGMRAQLLVRRSRVLLHRGALRDALAAARSAADAAVTAPRVSRDAYTQIAWALVRLGDEHAASAVDDVMRATDGAAPRDRARVLCMWAEHAWLSGTLLDPAPLTDAYVLASGTGLDWVRDDLARWCWRHGAPVTATGDLVPPFAAALAGDPDAAATAWEARGEPYEAAMATSDASEPDRLLAGLRIADSLDARPLGRLLRTRLRERGVTRLPRGPQTATRANPAGLTTRQLEVLVALSDGLTDAQIADRLVLSVRTVHHHVSAILAKLGVGSRTEAVERANDLGLLQPNETATT